MKTITSALTRIIILYILTIMFVVSLFVAVREDGLIQAGMSGIALVSLLLGIRTFGFYDAIFNRKAKDLSWMQSTLFERTINFRSRDKNVLYLTYGKGVFNITLLELYTRLKYDVANGKYNRVCNRDVWRSFGYHGNEIIAIKKYLLSIGVATGQETGSIKLLNNPAATIDIIKALNS